MVIRRRQAVLYGARRTPLRRGPSLRVQVAPQRVPWQHWRVLRPARVEDLELVTVLARPRGLMVAVGVRRLVVAGRVRSLTVAVIDRDGRSP